MRWLRRTRHIISQSDFLERFAEGVPMGMVARRCHCDYPECSGWALDFPPEYWAIVRRRWDDPRGRVPRLVKGEWTS